MAPERSSEFEQIVLQEISELKKGVAELRDLVACELYGANGRLGLKQQMAVLWEDREQTKNMKRMVLGAFLTGLASLVVTFIRWAIGI